MTNTMIEVSYHTYVTNADKCSHAIYLKGYHADAIVDCRNQLIEYCKGDGITLTPSKTKDIHVDRNDETGNLLYTPVLIKIGDTLPEDIEYERFAKTGRVLTILWEKTFKHNGYELNVKKYVIQYGIQKGLMDVAKMSPYISVDAVTPELTKEGIKDLEEKKKAEDAHEAEKRKAIAYGAGSHYDKMIQEKIKAHNAELGINPVRPSISKTLEALKIKAQLTPIKKNEEAGIKEG